MKWFQKNHGELLNEVLADAEGALDSLPEKADESRNFEWKEPERPGLEGHLESYATVLAKDTVLLGGASFRSAADRIGYCMRVRLDSGEEKDILIPEKVYNDITIGERSMLLLSKGALLDFGDRLGEAVPADGPVPEEALSPETEYPAEGDGEEEWHGPLDVSRIECFREKSEPVEPLAVRIAENALDLKLPAVYRDFLLQMNGAHTNFARLYSAEELLSMNQELHIDSEAPGYVSVGNDNITHELLMETKPNALRVLFVDTEELSAYEEPDLVLPSFAQWVEDGLSNPWED